MTSSVLTSNCSLQFELEDVNPAAAKETLAAAGTQVERRDGDGAAAICAGRNGGSGSSSSSNRNCYFSASETGAGNRNGQLLTRADLDLGELDHERVEVKHDGRGEEEADVPPLGQVLGVGPAKHCEARGAPDV